MIDKKSYLEFGNPEGEEKRICELLKLVSVYTQIPEYIADMARQQSKCSKVNSTKSVLSTFGSQVKQGFTINREKNGNQIVYDLTGLPVDAFFRG